MAWKKSSPELIETFDAVLPGAPAERRLMFGYPAGFVNGNMFMGLHEERLVLRLPEESRTELLSRGGKIFEPMAGRPMREYVIAPPALLADRPKLRTWTAKALAFAAALPKKTKKKPAPKKRAKP